MATRFRYKDPDSRSGFVELHPDYVPKPEQLFEWLEDSELVDRVEWQSSKTSQNNIGGHASERNIKVFPKDVPGQAAWLKAQGAGSATERFMEFGITRHAHMSENAACPYTVTVMFKDPAEHLFPCAWAILRDVCGGKELFPDKVNEWMTDVLCRYAGQEQKDAQEEEEPAPGSASAEPTMKRTSNDEPSEDEWDDDDSVVVETGSQALAGEGVLSRFTRPSFVQWIDLMD